MGYLNKYKKSKTHMDMLIEYKNMLVFIDLRVNGLRISINDRKVAAATLLDVANEHGKGICTLFEHNHDASAFAMMRIQFETFVRGTWLLHCATEKELNNFLEKDKIELDNKNNFNFGDMLKAVERIKGWSKNLSEIKNFSWRALNSYTHGGRFQVTRRFDGNTIEAHHNPEQRDETLRFSAMLSFLGFCEIIEISDNQDKNKLPDELYKKISNWVFL